MNIAHLIPSLQLNAPSPGLPRAHCQSTDSCSLDRRFSRIMAHQVSQLPRYRPLAIAMAETKSYPITQALKTLDNIQIELNT